MGRRRVVVECWWEEGPKKTGEAGLLLMRAHPGAHCFVLIRCVCFNVVSTLH